MMPRHLRRHPGGGLVLLALALAAIAPVRAAQLLVKTAPPTPNATVLLDYRQVGTTNTSGVLAIPSVSTGTHKITVQTKERIGTAVVEVDDPDLGALVRVGMEPVPGTGSRAPARPRRATRESAPGPGATRAPATAPARRNEARPSSGAGRLAFVDLGSSPVALAAAVSLTTAVLVLTVLAGFLVVQHGFRRRPASSITSFGEYKIRRFLARGGMATIYLAEPRGGGGPIVLKLLGEGYLEDQDLVRKFQREGEILYQLNQIDPAAPVVEVYAFGTVPFGSWPSYPFIAMEYLDGGSLLTLLQKKGRLPLREAAYYCAGVARALLPAHGLGIFHRDLDPQNVMLCSREKGGFRFRLIDFGIARHEYTSHGTLDGSIAGKPAYMSPEQCTGGKVDGRSDIYSLGIVFYTLLTGRPPFTSKNPLEVMQMHVTREIALDGVVPPAAAPLLRRMLAKKPEDRPPSIGLVLQELLPLWKA